VIRLVVALAAAMAIGVSVWRLESATDGLSVTHTHVGAIPMTVFSRAGGEKAPVVVIAHGFAGSRQLMLPFAVTLARNGFVAVTFDFPGHGRNPDPMSGGLRNDAARSGVLLAALDAVVGYAKTLPEGDGKIALLGHSMASDIVVRYAREHPDVAATVAVSLFSPGVTATSPRDLLVLAGALEPAMIRDEGFRVVGLAAGGPAKDRVTYGDFAAGTARRMALAGGVEHIGVLYSQQSLAEALAWMDDVFDRHGDGFLDDRAPWMGVLFGGLVALAWPLSRLLPRAADMPVGAGLPWKNLFPVAILPAILTPLILWKIPTDFLPSLLGDYFMVHFSVYGVLTAIGLFIARDRSGRRRRITVWPWRVIAAAAAVAAYQILAIGMSLDRYVDSFAMTQGRLPLLLVMLVGTLAYFCADEFATRGVGARPGGYALTKVCFLASLAIAIALNPPRLFFLIIIMPVMAVFLIIYGLLSTWAYRRALHPLVGALSNALALAWAITVTFPVVG
jgi:pimeloyl-ACP methyl ester carboxylesterase